MAAARVLRSAAFAMVMGEADTFSSTVAPARAVALTIVLINAPIIEAGAALTNQISALLVLVGRALVKDVGLRRP